MQDGTPWPGNNTRDHPGMIQVFLGHSGGLDAEGNELPRLVYVSREKRPGFHHHKKAGAMNALVNNSIHTAFVAVCLVTGPFKHDTVRIYIYIYIIGVFPIGRLNETYCLRITGSCLGSANKCTIHAKLGL